MSADNGYIVRKNEAGKFVLQEYSASADDYPPINAKGAMVYDTLGAAVLAYERLDDSTNYIEYGLRVQVQRVTINPQETAEIKARNIVFQHVKIYLEGIVRNADFGVDKVYVVSFTENSDGWAALVSTSLPDGKIYEVIHLGGEKQTTLTVYKRWEMITYDD